MSFKAILYAYVLGGLTFIPLVILALVSYTIYTSVPVGDFDADKANRAKLEQGSQEAINVEEEIAAAASATPPTELNDLPKPRKAWLTVRRTFEETTIDASYVGLVRGFLDARSKDPKRSRPKDMWYVVLKGKVLYLYEDESMTECDAAIELSGHDVVVYPEGLLDGELFAKRNAICLKPRVANSEKAMPSVTTDMIFGEDVEEMLEEVEEKDSSPKQKQKERDRILESEKKREETRAKAFDSSAPWFIFVRSNVEMEDWYLSLVHASDYPPNTSTLAPLDPVFQPTDMSHLVSTLDEQPDVIPMRWLNALIGRLFFSYYRTHALESYIIGRLMRKLAKIKRPGFLTHIVVREVSVGNKAPTLSKPMLKELTKEGDASLEVHLHYKGEIRITIEAVATINLGTFKSYTVKLILAAVLREMEGNLLVKVKRPPSNRIWYAFTTMPRMVLDVEPVVSDRQITWSMVLSQIESRLKEMIQESVVLPNMDDIAFFESSQYSRRGGIWADASRHEKQSSILTPPTPVPAEDVQVTASEPITGSCTPLSGSDTNPPLHRSQSAEETQPDVGGSSGPPEPVPLVRPATTTGLSPIPNDTTPKRRTWFGGRERSGSSYSGTTVPEGFEDMYERGRPMGTEGNGTRRSSSTRSSNEGSVNGSDTLRPGSSSEDTTHLTPIPIRRSSSRHSQYSSSQDASGPSSLDNASSSAPSESNMATYRTRSPSISGSQKNMPTSPTFFQTLKSRDKQAISNTAKEAMRKWGVNWGGLRKDSESSSAPEDVADGEHLRPPEQKVHKARPSYAEVRAAVAQRKERERATHGDTLRADSLSPEPFVGQGRERAASSSSSNGPGRAPSPTYSGGAALSPSTSPYLDINSRDPSPSRLAVDSPPLTRQRTTSRKSVPPIESIFTPPSGLPDEDEHPAVPIHTQPAQPKMMMIPGIHASHRGEVMSMGYAPPTPTPPEPKKTPAIQSVYRLWKNPTTSGQQSQVETGSDGHDQDADPSISSFVTLQGQPERPPLPARPIPPPLPPRSNSTHAVPSKPELPKPFPEMERTSSPASAALQSIVTKDRTKRASLEPSPSAAVTGNTTPPDQRGDTEAEPQQARSDAATTSSNFNAPSSSGDVGISAVGVSPKPPALPPRRVSYTHVPTA